MDGKREVLFRLREELGGDNFALRHLVVRRFTGSNLEGKNFCKPQIIGQNMTVLKFLI